MADLPSYIATKPPKGAINLTVIISKRFKLRMWMGLLFLKIAAKILRANVEIEKEDQAE